MNISQPLWGELISSAANYSTNGSTVAAPNNLTVISENDADAIIDTISSSGTYLWSFEMYWAVAAPATLATILLPLVAGPTVRFLVTISYHNRTYARIIGTLVLIGGLTVADLFLWEDDYLYVFGIGCGVPTFAVLCVSSWFGKDQWLWCGFSIIFAECIVFEWYFSDGLTNWVPFVYLMIIWWIDYILTMPTPFVQRMKKFSDRTLDRLQKLYMSHQKRWIWLSIFVYYGLAGVVYWTGPAFILIIVFGIPLGVQAINRFVHSLAVKEKRRYWLLYLIVYTGSVATDISILITSPTTTAPYQSWAQTTFVPVAYLILAWLWANYQGKVKAYFERFRNRAQNDSDAPNQLSNGNVEMQAV